MRRMFVAIGLATVVQFGMALAAGPFDGSWKGTTSRGPYVGGGTCPSIDMTLTVVDGKVTGKTLGAAVTGAFSGDVAADGTFKGISSYSKPLEGKFSGDTATGTYQTVDCGMVTFSLQRAK